MSAAKRLSRFLFIYFFITNFSFLTLAQKGTIAIILDKKNPSFRFTADEMKTNLEKKGYAVLLSDLPDLKKTKAQNRFILTVRASKESSDFLKDHTVTLPNSSKAQGYSIRKKTFVGSSDWYIIGNDKNGVIYGGLDASETIKLNGFNKLTEVDKEPYITNRGIKFNIPLDARTPSYSDNGDAAQQNIANMWDINFWHEFLDELARDRFNVLSIWSLSPFPSLVDVPEYPNAGLNDVQKTTGKLLPTTDALFMSTAASLSKLVTVKKITLAGKIKFWKSIMQYASDRGIDTYLFTWNLFVYGTENSGYGFTDKTTDEKTKDYIRKATKELIITYPLLKGIGLTAGENMMRLQEAAKEKFLYESYGEGINDALAENTTRKFKLIHRAHQADIEIIKDAFSALNPNCRLDFSYKYSVAQMYSSVAPKYIHESKFLEHIGDSKFFLTVRDDAFYNLRGGSDPTFAREYFKNIPKKNFEGFYVGPDGYTWGREYLRKSSASPRQLVLKKRWYSFQLLGKLSYDPDIPDAHFADLLKDRFPEVNANKLLEAWAAGSRVMPFVNRFHNERAQNDFQWYPEACTSFYGFRSVDNFINSAPQKGEGLLSIPEYSNAFLQNKNIEGVAPIAVAKELQKLSEKALSLLSTMTNTKNKELIQTITDIKAMAFLGQYYSRKILGATYKDLYTKAASESKKVQYRNDAIKNLKEASDNWRKYANEVTASYIPQHLTRMHFTVDFKAIQAHVDKEFAMLTAGISETGLSKTPPIQKLEVVFSNNSNYYFWHLDKLGLPSNWSSFKYLAVEVFATGEQPFDLILQAGADTLVAKNISVPKMRWKEILIPLDSFKKQMAHGGNSGNDHYASNASHSMDEVIGLGVYIKQPVGYPVLEIRSVKLSKIGTGGNVFLSTVHHE